MYEATPGTREVSMRKSHGEYKRVLLKYYNSAFTKDEYAPSQQVALKRKRKTILEINLSTDFQQHIAHRHFKYTHEEFYMKHVFKSHYQKKFMKPYSNPRINGTFLKAKMEFQLKE
eukprot:gene10782-3400_t